MPNKRYQRCILVMTLLWVLGGCRGTDDVAHTDPPTASTASAGDDDASGHGERSEAVWTSASAAAERGGKAVFGELGDIDSLNTYTHETLFGTFVIDLLFCRLADEQADYQKGPPSFAPRLAESWERLPDRRSMKFTLREGLVWSDGQPLTADDLRFTWQAALNTEVAWSNRTIAGRITDVEVVDERTAIYHYDGDYPYQLMDANDLTVIPKHVFGKVPFAKWREYDWNRPEALVFSGPYKLERYVAQVELVLVPNESYYDFGKGLPRLDRVVFRIVPDADALFTGGLAATFDMLRAFEPKNAQLVEDSKTLDLAAVAGRRYTHICWNNIARSAVTELVKEKRAKGEAATVEDVRELRAARPHPLFGDARVRRAMAMAVDRDRIIANAYKGYAKPLIGPILSTFWAHNDTIAPYPYDPTAAKKLLTEAGWSDSDGDGILDKAGVKFEFELLTNAGNKIRETVQELMAEDLGKLGIGVIARKLEWTVFVETTRNKDFDAYVGGWGSATKVDLKPTYHSESILTGFNRGGYISARVDELIDSAREEADYLAAKPKWDEIQQILHDEQPFTYVAELYDLNAIHKRFRNVTIGPANPYQYLHEWTVPAQLRIRN